MLTKLRNSMQTGAVIGKNDEPMLIMGKLTFVSWQSLGISCAPLLSLLNCAVSLCCDYTYWKTLGRVHGSRVTSRPNSQRDRDH